MLARITCALLVIASSCAQLISQQPQRSAPTAPAQHQPVAAAMPAAPSFRIAGTVVNSLTAQPLASVSVAIARVTQGADREISKSVVTAADGRFSFTGLSRGKYSLMAEARGFALQYFEHHDPYATAIAVGPDLDSEHLVFRLQPDASIEGAVTDENNEPVQNAQVRLFQRSTEGGQQKTLPVNQVQTDDQGHYRLGHLSPGTYYLAVSARPWYAQNVRSSSQNYSPYAQNRYLSAQTAQEDAALDVTYPLTFYPDATDSADATPLQLAPGEKTTADIVLHAIPSLHLRIHTGSAAETGVLGRMVFPRVSQRVFEGYLDSVFNAPDSWVAHGVIEVSGLAPGHYVVEMPAATGLDQKISGRSWYREIDLSGDADVNPSEGPTFATVSGTIAFEGVPRVPKGAALQLSNPETGEVFRSDIGERGEFDFRSDDIRPGRYMLGLEGVTGFFLSKLTATGGKIIGRMIEIGGTGAVRVSGVASPGAARVNGTAMREEEPFAGAMVVLVPHDPANNGPLFRRDQSDSDGTFTLPNVVPGQYTVIAIANGWDMEWANPAVLQPYLRRGETVQVPIEGSLQVKLQVQ